MQLIPEKKEILMHLSICNCLNRRSLLQISYVVPAFKSSYLTWLEKQAECITTKNNKFQCKMQKCGIEKKP